MKKILKTMSLSILFITIGISIGASTKTLVKKNFNSKNKKEDKPKREFHLLRIGKNEK